MEIIQEVENIDKDAIALKNQRILYVIVQCFPISLIVRASQSRSLIIPLVLHNDALVKDVYQKLYDYFDTRLDAKGLYFIKNSSKLILSDKNHQIFECLEQ
jgi:hypothetical protein